MLQCSCKMFLSKHRSSCASCRCIAVGSNRQQQLILKVSKFSLQMCRSTETTGPDVIVDLELDYPNCLAPAAPLGQLVEQAENQILKS